MAQFATQASILYWQEQFAAFSPDSTRLALLYEDRVEIRAANTGELLNQLDWDASITDIKFSSLRLQPETAQPALLLGTENGEIRAINPATRAQIATFTLGSEPITAFNLHPNGRLLAIASRIPTATMLQVYDIQQKTLIFGLTLSVTDDYEDPLDAQALAFSEDGTALLAIFDDYNYYLRFYAWDLRTAAAIEPASQIWYNLYSPHADLQGHLINSISTNTQITLTNLHTNKTLAQLTYPQNSYETEDTWISQVNPNHSYFALKMADGILVWNLQQPTENSKLLTGHELLGGDGWWGSIGTFAFNPNTSSGRLLASTGHDQTLRLWDVGSGAQLRTFNDARRGLYLLCFSPDGRYIAAYGYDGVLRLLGIP